MIRLTVVMYILFQQWFHVKHTTQEQEPVESDPITR